MAQRIADTRPIKLLFDDAENKFISNSYVTTEEATHIAVRKEDYISKDSYMELLKDYNNLKGKVLDDGMVAIPKEEYNGLKKALRIIDDRALQQIDKSKADENGLRLLRADFRIYDYSNKRKLWLITKETDYSSKFSPEDAYFLIDQKLRKIYYFMDEVDLQSYSDTPLESHERYFDMSSIAKCVEDWNNKSHQYDFLGDNSAVGRAMYRCFKEHGSSMICEIAKFSTNYAQGVYEVSYWATELI